MRTVINDFATVKFTAEITFTAGDGQAMFFGLGTGDRALFGTPDWSTQLSSASFWPETNTDKFTQFKTNNDSNAFVDTNVPGFPEGTHRFRMTFDPVTGFLVGSIDVNYAGGPFVADVTGFPIATKAALLPNAPTGLFSADGWPTEPSRVFFGGDDGVTFRDLTITVVPEPATWMLAMLGVAAVVGRSALLWQEEALPCCERRGELSYVIISEVGTFELECTRRWEFLREKCRAAERFGSFGCLAILAIRETQFYETTQDADCRFWIVDVGRARAGRGRRRPLRRSLTR